MQEILELLSTDLFQRALITSSMVGLMCGILGTFLVLRNMSLIGDALSHSVLPGIFFAFVIVQSYSSIAFFIGSSIAGLVAALSISWIQQNIFVSTFQETIAQTMGIPTRFLHYFLLLMLSFVVVASLQAVGVILVVAMLVTPASTALLLSNKMRNVIIVSALLGLFAAILGLIASIIFDFPPGPTMAVVSGLFYLVAVLFSPEHGVIFKFIRERKESNRIEKEDVIKYVFKNKDASINEVASYIGLSKAKMNNLISSLVSNGFINRSSGILQLTSSGEVQANKLIRAHRLWETYQVEAMGMDASKIHPDAERMEHHLSKDMMDKIAKDLGNPDVDPHGSPIPPRSK